MMPKPDKSPDAPPKRPPSKEHDHIADNLKTLFKGAESEPLPDRFTELLNRPAQEERK